MARLIYEIAKEIQNDWKKPYYGAVPYIEAMESLETIDQYFIQDPAKEIVARFLSNAANWRGEVARRVKAELKEMMK